MEDFRSRPCGHGRSQMESYNGGPTSSGVNVMQDLRCYSASYATSVHLSSSKPRREKTVTISGMGSSDPNHICRSVDYDTVTPVMNTFAEKVKNEGEKGEIAVGHGDSLHSKTLEVVDMARRTRGEIRPQGTNWTAAASLAWTF
ncbi:hypothetical protein D8674_007198 [Pyrus ussuriensis x Pyrus communis]|uniref:Uncharacterized protein n=1 Tax=Pyrus ussuriensis x Pyrus communis TaxID=2448454 RepID=A0A5N5G126_9ROSA|nr:hypothetical protein D8674_007198 [Pyrus ussuriensis x Pyrus communis]